MHIFYLPDFVKTVIMVFVRHKNRIKVFLMLVFPFVWISVWINNHAEINTRRNTNIKNSFIRFCDTDKKRTDKVRGIKYTHKRKHSLKVHSWCRPDISNSLFLMILYIFIPKCFDEKAKIKTEPCQSLRDIFFNFSVYRSCHGKEYSFIFRVVVFCGYP